jgi:4-diphosphocytidyl-2-C-methyl-D-erythritol kinase
MAGDRSCQLETQGTGLLIRAPAKLNLSLLIAGRRPDGFHEIETVMAKIDWHDELRIARTDVPGIQLICQGDYAVPQDPTNLVYRAAANLFENCQLAPSVRLTLTKNVPPGSGLGSGSSDAAATLLGLDALLDLALPQSALTDLAAQIGSDVPFFLNGPLAFCTGRGEQVRHVSTPFPFTALLILPDLNSSTKRVYANYNHDEPLYRRLHCQIEQLLARDRIDALSRMCANMLQQSCFGLYEELGRLKKTVESLGIGPVCLSGSGSSLFVLIDDADVGRTVQACQEITSRTGCRCIVVRNNGW